MDIFKKKEDQFDYSASRICITCKTHFSGRYCTKCGEKVIEPSDRSLKYFMSGLLNAYTFIDGKFFTSLKTLITAPGQLSADISVGRRQPYMKPIALFFVGNFIYFFFPIFETFNTTLDAQINGLPYSNYAREILISIHPDYETESFQKIYQSSSTNWSKILLILMVPLFFPLVTIINFTKQKFLSDQLIYSLEFVTFLLFAPTILYGFFLFIVVNIAQLVGFNIYFLFYDAYTIWVILSLLVYFLLRSSRKFYRFQWWRTILNAILLLLSTVIVITTYRFILFYITIKSI